MIPPTQALVMNLTIYALAMDLMLQALVVFIVPPNYHGHRRDHRHDHHHNDDDVEYGF